MGAPRRLPGGADDPTPGSKAEVTPPTPDVVARLIGAAKQTKANRARRIAIDQRTLDALAAHKEFQEQRAQAIGVRLDPVAFVCSHTADGSRPLRPDEASSRFRHLSRSLDVPNVRLHDLRHFAATHLLAAGVHALRKGVTLDP